MTGIGTTSTMKATASLAPSLKDLGQTMIMSATTNVTWSTDRGKNVLAPFSFDQPSSAISLSKVALPTSLEHLALGQSRRQGLGLRMSKYWDLWDGAAPHPSWSVMVRIVS